MSLAASGRGQNLVCEEGAVGGGVVLYSSSCVG